MKVKTLSISSHLEGPHKGAPRYVCFVSFRFGQLNAKKAGPQPKKGVTRVVRVISLPQWTLFFCGVQRGATVDAGDSKLDQANARQLSCAVRQT